MHGDGGDKRSAAEWIVRTLSEAGHVAYFAGGCVRDELLGLRPKDYDVATDARPDVIERLFARTRAVGKSFGVMLVSVPRSRAKDDAGNGIVVEVATFRREHGYSDKRRPDAVSFCDARSDAFRRDFTVNALFIDPLDKREHERGRVIDYVGGVEDLHRRVLRAVGDPDARLAEDHLRALRAARIASRLGFTIDPATADAVRRHARQLSGVSRERIGEEVRRMLAGEGRGRALELLHRLGLDGPVLEEESLEGAMVDRVGRLPPDAPFGAALAAWAACREEFRLGAEGNGADKAPGPFDLQPLAHRLNAQREGIVRRYRRALCLSNDERDELAGILECLTDVILRWQGLGIAGRKRLAARREFSPAIEVCRIWSTDVARLVSGEVEEMAAARGGLRPDPVVSGDDLLAAGLDPGPNFGRWLDRLYDLQLEGKLTTVGPGSNWSAPG